MTDRDHKFETIELTGRMVTAVDPAQLGKGDFQSLSNMRYTDRGIRSVRGQTKLTGSLVPAVPSASFFFKKQTPVVENHLLIQKDAGSGPRIYDSEVEPPGSISSFASIFTESTTAGTGTFTEAPDGAVAFGDSEDLVLWGGNYHRAGQVLLADTNDLSAKPSILFNHTDVATDVATATTFNVGQRFLYIASTRQLDGIHFDVATANNATAAAKVYYWGFGNFVVFFYNSTNVGYAPDAYNWDYATLSSSSPWYYAAWNGHTYVAIPSGSTNVTTYSTDGYNWSAGTLATTTNWRALASDGNQFVAINNTNVTNTSPDGINWTAHTIAVSAVWTDLLWTEIDGFTPRFIAISQPVTTVFAYSFDGITFTATTASSAHTWWAVASNSTVIVAVAYDGTTDTTYSLDGGVTWAAGAALPYAFSWPDIVWTGSRFVAITVDGYSAWSADGHSSWTAGGELNHAASWQTLSVSNGLILATSNGTAAALSYDGGLTWTPITLAYSGAYAAIGVKGKTWTPTTAFTDGTQSGGKTLAQSGKMSFYSTVGLAQQRYFNNVLAYWYLVDFNRFGAVQPTTEVSQVSCSSRMQAITDLWDGVPRTIAACQKFTYSGGAVSAVDDIAPLVYSQDYGGSAADYTYADLNGVGGSTHALYVGFTTKMKGLGFVFATGNTATTATVNVQFWNGEAWNNLDVIDNTTYGTSGTMNKSGVVYWNLPEDATEYETNTNTPIVTIFGAGTDRLSTHARYQLRPGMVALTPSVSTGGTPDLFYYYRVTFSAALANCVVDHIYGIPAPIAVDTFQIPATFQNRLVLLNDSRGEYNAALIGGADTNCVFNGDDTAKLYFGGNQKIVAALPFFSRFSNVYAENLVVAKQDSLWLVDGNAADNYVALNVTETYGVAAPKTLTRCDLTFSSGLDGGISRSVLIWQSAGAIVMWDGATVFPIDADIRDIFDQTSAKAINPSLIAESRGFYDENQREWHWLFASGVSASLNEEYVFDIIRRKWFDVNRAYSPIRLGQSVSDTKGNVYSYGVDAAGHTYRLEYGQTFGTNGVPDIVSSFWTGDIPLAGWSVETIIRKVKVLARSKANVGLLQVEIYGDTASAPVATVEINLADGTHRIAQSQTPGGTAGSLRAGPHTFFSLKCTMTTNNQDIGFEPIGLALVYQVIRESFR